MIASMTGFSRYEQKEKGCVVVVEVRSLNNRFLDVFVKLPRRFSEFEDDVKNSIRGKLSRGKIDVYVTIDGLDESVQDVSVNVPLARKYFEAFKSLEKTFNIPITITPENLLRIEDLFEYTISDEKLNWVKKLILKTLNGALQELQKHKREEGRNLEKDFRKRLDAISHSLEKIQRLFKSRYKEDFELFKTRIARILKDVEKVDPARLEIEAAIMAEKFDISEECVRTDSHLKMFKNSLKSSEAVGRRLDFILQEINREVNTISAKSNNVLISQEVVRIKEEIDRLKEQVRNVE